MNIQTSLANVIDISDTKARYDANAKAILSHNEILAWILKGCAVEFKDFTIEFIKTIALRERRKYL